MSLLDPRVIRTSPLSRDLIVGALQTLEPILACVAARGQRPVVAGTAALLLYNGGDSDIDKLAHPHDIDILSAMGLTDLHVAHIIEALVAAGKITKPVQRNGEGYDGESYHFDVIVGGIAVPIDWMDPYSLGARHRYLLHAMVAEGSVAGNPCPYLSLGAVLGLKFLAKRPRDLQELPRLLGSEGGPWHHYAYYEDTFRCLAKYEGVDAALDFYDEIRKSIPTVQRPDPAVVHEALKYLVNTYKAEVPAEPRTYPEGATLATSVRLLDLRDYFIRYLRRGTLPDAGALENLNTIARVNLGAQETLIAEHREGRGVLPLSNVDIVAASSPVRRVLALTRAYATPEATTSATPVPPPPVVEITLHDPVVIPAPLPLAPINIRKKPVVVQAMRWDGTYDGVLKLMKWSTGSVRWYGTTGELRCEVVTLEGPSLALVPGAWLIKGVKGEFYPCADDVLRETYDFEPVEPEQPVQQGRAPLVAADESLILQVRKAPVVVHALRWRGEIAQTMFDFLGYGPLTTLRDSNTLVISTPAGALYCPRGSWVVRGTKGEPYVVRDDIFRETYDLVQALAPNERPVLPSINQ